MQYVAFDMFKFSTKTMTIPNSNLWGLQEDDGVLQWWIHLYCGKAYHYDKLLQGSAQIINTFVLTVVFYLARIATNLMNTTQKSALVCKLFRTFKFLNSSETDTNILQNFKFKNT